MDCRLTLCTHLSARLLQTWIMHSKYSGTGSAIWIHLWLMMTRGRLRRTSPSPTLSEIYPGKCDDP
jgi:hypothetical protein